MSGFAGGEVPSGQDEFREEEQETIDELTRARKIVFSSTLEEPLTWANSTLVRGDAAEQVRELKQQEQGLLSTLGSLSLCRSLLKAGLVDRFRVVMFPVITGATGEERIYDGYPDVALEMTEHRTFEGGLQLVEYKPRVLERPPLPVSCHTAHRNARGAGQPPGPSACSGSVRVARDEFVVLVNVTWVAPLGDEIASTWKSFSTASRPVHRLTPRPSTIGTTTMCM